MAYTGKLKGSEKKLVTEWKKAGLSFGAILDKLYEYRSEPVLLKKFAEPIKKKKKKNDESHPSPGGTIQHQ